MGQTKSPPSCLAPSAWPSIGLFIIRIMAIPFVPWQYEHSALELLPRLRARGYQVVAVEQAHNSVSYTEPVRNESGSSNFAPPA